MTTQTDLNLLVKDVAHLRQQHEAAAQKVRDAKQRWDDENADIVLSARNLGDALTFAEKNLRDRAIAEFKATGDKAPCEGVAINMFRRIDYDPQQALGWALDHKLCLNLDKRAFEKTAKATGANGGLSFVHITEEPQATIATDLSQYVKDD